MILSCTFLLQIFNVYNYLFYIYNSTVHIIFYVFNKININKHRTEYQLNFEILNPTNTI